MEKVTPLITPSVEHALEKSTGSLAEILGLPTGSLTELARRSGALSRHPAMQEFIVDNSGVTTPDNVVPFHKPKLPKGI